MIAVDPLMKRSWRCAPRLRRAAEAAIPMGIFVDRRDQRRPVEIRPEDRQEDEFGVGRLPQQEIRQPLLAGGADDEVRIRECRPCRAGARSRRRRSRRASGGPAATISRERARRRRDLLPRAIVESDDEGQTRCWPASICSASRSRDRDVGGEIVARADDAHAHIIGVQLR